jgi:beta-lactamase class A
MWQKAVVTFLVGLHLLPLSALKSLKPNNTPERPPFATQIPAVKAPKNNNLSIADTLYADLALQHELDHVSVFYFDGDPKHTVSINPDKNWDPASTIKLYAAMYAFDQVSHGKISLDQTITIDAKNVAPSESYLNGYDVLSEGNDVTVFRLVDQMITQSDNTAFNTLLDLLDRQEITKYIHDIGLTNSSVGSKLNLNDNQQPYEVNNGGYGLNLITANDYAKAFILINGGRIPGSTDLFNILSRQKLNTMLPAFLPKTVTVAHKTGELDPYYHDGGIIVDNDRKYVLSVFSDMGSPNVVAHISDLVYTDDINLVGSNQSPLRSTGGIPNAPIDPLVVTAAQEPSLVLAANTQKVNLPKVTASDVGIEATDLTDTLDQKQLPPVIIPRGSPFHFLVTLGEQIRILTNPIPISRTNYTAQNLKQDLAEANDLLVKGKKTEANEILRIVDDDLAQIAKDPTVAGNVNLQKTLNAISETRFSILGNEIINTEDSDQKALIIKDIATAAINTSENVKPYLADLVKIANLAQTPVVGEVIRTTPNSLIIKTADGREVTTPLQSQIKTRNAGQTDSQISSPSKISVGSTVAVAGSFVLTNIAADAANPKPVKVLKVNLDTNTLVIQSANGTPQQIDLTEGTVIKGTDTSISLDQIKPGDVIVVHGKALPTSSSTSEKASTTPNPTSSGSSKEVSKKETKTPQVIEGNVIQVVQSNTNTTTRVSPVISSTPIATAQPSSLPVNSSPTPAATQVPQPTPAPTPDDSKKKK